MGCVITKRGIAWAMHVIWAGSCLYKCHAQGPCTYGLSLADWTDTLLSTKVGFLWIRRHQQMTQHD